MMRDYNKYKKIKTRKKSFNPYMILAIFAALIIAMSIGYGAYSDVLKIAGTANARYTNYIINYELNNGTNPSNPVSTFTIADDFLLPIPTRNNHDFGGWYLYSDFSGNAVVTTGDIDAVALNPTNDTVILYAKWTASVVNYTITYNNITNSTNYPSTISGGSTYTQTFTTAPSSVTVTMGGTNLVSGTGFTYSNGTLTIPNVSGNLVITGSSSGGGNGGTWNNPVEDTTTTQYDPEDVPEGTTIYTNVPGKPKVTADENGNITQFEYTNTVNGVPVPSGGLDTGVLAFDGSDFVVTLKAKFTFSNCTTSIAPIINASKKDPDVNGVLIYEFREPKAGYGHTASGSNVNPPFNKFRYGKYENSSSKGNVDYNIAKNVTGGSSNNRYGYNASTPTVTLTIKLYCTNGVFTSEIYDDSGTLLAKPYNNTSYSFANLDSSFDNVTIVIGEYEGFGSGVVYRHTFDILEFSVLKS